MVAAAALPPHDTSRRCSVEPGVALALPGLSGDFGPSGEHLTAQRNLVQPTRPRPAPPGPRGERSGALAPPAAGGEGGTGRAGPAPPAPVPPRREAAASVTPLVAGVGLGEAQRH